MNAYIREYIRQPCDFYIGSGLGACDWQEIIKVVFKKPKKIDLTHHEQLRQWLDCLLCRPEDKILEIYLIIDETTKLKVLVVALQGEVELTSALEEWDNYVLLKPDAIQILQHAIRLMPDYDLDENLHVIIEADCQIIVDNDWVYAI